MGDRPSIQKVFKKEKETEMRERDQYGLLPVLVLGRGCLEPEKQPGV